MQELLLHNVQMRDKSRVDDVIGPTDMPQGNTMPS